MATNIRSVQLGDLFIQSGDGIPIHLSPKGTIFVDLTGPSEYLSNSDGTWFKLGVSSSGVTGFDVYVTGATYSNGTAIFTNNTGGTFSVSGFSTGGGGGDSITGGTYDNSSGTLYLSSTASTISITGFTTGSTDTYVTGGTSNPISKTYTFTNNTGGTFTVTAIPDVFVTGGTYTAGTATFTNTTGGTFNVTGFTTGATSTLYQVLVAGSDANNEGIENLGNIVNTSGTYTNTMWNSTGYWAIDTRDSAGNGQYAQVEVNGSNAIPYIFNVVNDKGASYLTDVWVGVTQNHNSLVIEKNPYNVSQLFSGATYAADYSANFTPRSLVDKGYVTSAITSALSLTTDVRVTGGTYSSGTAIFTNNTGGTFSVSGFTTGTGSTGFDVYVTGATYNNANQFTFTNNTGGTFGVSFNEVSGLTVNGGLSATSISANTIYSGSTDLNTILFSKLKAVKMTSHTVLAPADATTYYIGVNAGLAAQITPLFNIFSFPVDCIIKNVTLEVRQAKNGSIQTSTIYLRENDSTDYTISGSVSNSFGTDTSTSIVITGLTIPILASNFYTTKIVCPTWATNPNGVIYTTTYYGY